MKSKFKNNSKVRVIATANAENMKKLGIDAGNPTFFDKMKDLTVVQSYPEGSSVPGACVKTTEGKLHNIPDRLLEAV